MKDRPVPFLTAAAPAVPPGCIGTGWKGRVAGSMAWAPYSGTSSLLVNDARSMAGSLLEAARFRKVPGFGAGTFREF